MKADDMHTHRTYHDSRRHAHNRLNTQADDMTFPKLDDMFAIMYPLMVDDAR